MTHNKHAIITGGSRGIGFALAKYLSLHGYRLLLIARNETNLKIAISQLKGDHNYVAMDVADYDQINKAIKNHINANGQIDLLINSAGYVKRGSSTLSPNEFIQMLNTNLIGVFNCIHSVATQMKEQRFGRIINIASYSSKIARAPLGGYAASKFGALGLNEALYKELAEFGIYVTAICPNLVDTDMTADVKLPAKEKIPTSDIVNTLDYLLKLSPSTAIKEIVIQCRTKLLTENT